MCRAGWSGSQAKKDGTTMTLGYTSRDYWQSAKSNLQQLEESRGLETAKIVDSVLGAVLHSPEESVVERIVWVLWLRGKATGEIPAESFADFWEGIATAFSTSIHAERDSSG